MLKICEKSFDILISQGYKVHLVNVGTIKPLSVERLNELLNKSKIAVTVEDNVISGGAGEYMLSKASRNNKHKLINFGFPDVFIPQGSQSELFEIFGLTEDKIVETIKKEMVYYEQQT